MCQQFEIPILCAFTLRQVDNEKSRYETYDGRKDEISFKYYSGQCMLSIGQDNFVCDDFSNVYEMKQLEGVICLTVDALPQTNKKDAPSITYTTFCNASLFYLFKHKIEKLSTCYSTYNFKKADEYISEDHDYLWLFRSMSMVRPKLYMEQMFDLNNDEIHLSIVYPFQIPRKNVNELITKGGGNYYSDYAYTDNRSAEDCSLGNFPFLDLTSQDHQIKMEADDIMSVAMDCGWPSSKFIEFYMEWMRKQFPTKIVTLPPKWYYDLMEDGLSTNISSDLIFNTDVAKSQMSDAVIIFLPFKTTVGEPWRLMVSFHPNRMEQFRKLDSSSLEYKKFFLREPDNHLTAHVVLDFSKYQKFDSQKLIGRMNALLDSDKEGCNLCDYREERIVEEKRYNTMMGHFGCQGIIFF